MRANSNQCGNIWRTIENNVRKDLKTSKVFLCSKDGDIEKYTRFSLENSAEVIIAVGGDGTIHAIINLILAERSQYNYYSPKLVIVPLGTGCDFARSINFSTNYSTIAHAIESKKSYAVDIGKIEITDNTSTYIKYFLNVSLVGLGAYISETKTKMPKIPFMHYIIPSLIGILSHKHEIYEIEIANKQKIFDCLLLAIANGSYCGKGMNIAPNAQLDSGVFELVALTKLNKIKLFYHFSSIYSGKHLKLKEIETIQCDKLSIHSPNKLLPIDLDGECYYFRKIRAECINKSLSFIRY